MKRGHSLVELAFGLILLAALLWLWLGNRPPAAPLARTVHDAKPVVQALNVDGLQEAYERAKLQNPEILTNSTVLGLTEDLVSKGFITKGAVDHIALRSGTTINGGNAIFVQDPTHN